MKKEKKLEMLYSEVTKPSEEQPTMFQVQGSTELISHPSNTCFSSLISLFIDISAATACIVQERPTQYSNN